MTIDSYFASLPDGFASIEQMRDLLPAPVQKVTFVGVAGTAGKTAVAAFLAMQAVNRWLSVSVSMEHRWTKACSA